ncbi:WecB/TagA/CpsF family glycosyltransferase [Pseudoteredinibacter isoporae]|uniref:N-acetylglucosaminyldiphosphoundecaprenol N-acetyl-beta-D-mannosaminyltransferase n=1 Tax=Pseudoteredinibacter isoporae TaxID=570281 RepID=A0A7X0JXG4_9GAMM|nr:WecB/TagA/CpsF family glycosyltransferase [Pseudoteredinibacter isoporae]MBB6523071.1 N-acetylglucosaminyldiphosphoundecaprenol N-acetyl-beta-D-mannosaminyltransferase [Pseudoteredinibacter isoporae]NHO88591.1 WecB/TagA/CpsF family glycosyltransferase [Pseudoteredinibacter isoporae]NIB22718.1 WecB/TagA/CpsF family glycosyltransferase [Pseudoteredinibacter isoporae]
MHSRDRLSTRQHPFSRVFDITIASAGLILCSPVYALAAARSYFRSEPCLRREIALDALHRPVHLLYLRNTDYANCGLLLSVMKGNLSLFGIDRLPSNATLETRRSAPEVSVDSAPAPGLLSLASAHRDIGLIPPNETLSLEQQFDSLRGFRYVSSFCRSVFTQLFFSGEKLRRPDSFYLFGLRINNNSMQEALDWLFSPYSGECETGVFVNVNSINQSHKDKALKSAINRADRVFADGSGVRLGARKQGVHLKGNINGTDLLPRLCERAQESGLKIFLLGSKPGVAAQAARNLCQRYPFIHIAGVQHGYIENDDEGRHEKQLLEKINRSHADILLLGLGSPRQEQWLERNRKHLSCRKAIAVGGLFDYYSGNIPRAPLFLREMGFEWLWRLAQEPRQKWQRYVYGNPLYLFRLFRMKRSQ